ncbi:alpha/beta fold hydrolase [Kitasatospora aureofaciens]|uniref:alpha/beta fold hydrolase n=1 Tax=Kitasatospora aureofaciens TaxID=1894 RepID=UPI001C4739E0|nr:alpha/beta hydrolase [Kitasatospora aureofaciens]MBV6700669.1 alpha/beta hydrolase [Kitasatospora aureofaciens]
MPTFPAHDSTRLTYHLSGDGAPLVCLAGGPMQDSAYLGDLGGLAQYRQVVRLDLRGTGSSAVPADPGSYRCDRQVDDVEALRLVLGLERLDLLAHCAGANLALRYAERYSDRIGRLVLITPSPLGVGIAVPGEVRREAALLRKDEPWFAEAFAALESIVAGRATAADWSAITPFVYGRWGDAARSHKAAESTQRNGEAAAAYGAEGAYDPAATRAGLARLDGEVLVLAGEFDLNSPVPAMAELAELFPRAEFAVQAGAGHFPWLDDAERFVAVVGAFLSGGI